MKEKLAYKTSLCLLSIVTAVVLCALSLQFFCKDAIYIYTKDKHISQIEEKLIKNLEKKRYKVVINPNDIKGKRFALWFREPNEVRKIMSTTSFEYNFIYSEAYYDFQWDGLDKLPIMLTPYQELHEHYMRSNVKSAIFVVEDENSSQRLIDLITWLKENN